MLEICLCCIRGVVLRKFEKLLNGVMFMKIDMKKALCCLLGLTFLQDSSADVTKLRSNSEISKNFVNNEYRKPGLHIVKIVR